MSLFIQKHRVFFSLLASLVLVFSFFWIATPTPAFADVTDVRGAFDAVADCAGAPGQCVFQVIIHIGIWTMQLSLFVLAIVGVLLDLAMLLTFNMGAIINPASGAGQAVAAGWTVFRDLANLMFIAGMIWVSMAMIFQVNVGGQTREKFITNVLIAALLVNFSYFFTGVIIDASNTTSRLIYEQGVLNGTSVELRDISIGGLFENLINPGTSIVEDTSVAPGEFAAVTFIGSQFLNQTRLISIFDPEILSDRANAGATLNLGLIIYAGIVFIGLTIELFASMFFVILARFVVLIVLLVLSPLLVFRIMTIKPFSDWGEQWWKELMNQVLFLPVFVFMLAVAFRVIGGFYSTFVGTDASLSKLIGDPSAQDFQDALGLIILFAIAYTLLKYTKSVAQNISQGANVPLPSAAAFQKGAASWGGAVGQRARAFGLLPKTGLQAGLGATLNAGASVAGGIAGAVGNTRTLRDIQSRLDPNRDRFMEQRNARTLQDVPNKIKTANRDIAFWKARVEEAEKTGDAQQLTAAQGQVDRAQNKRKSAVNDMYDALGPEKMASRVDALDEKNRQETFDALGPEKTKAITDLWRSGKGKKGGKDAEEARASGLTGEKAPAPQTNIPEESASSGTHESGLSNELVDQLKDATPPERVRAFADNMKELSDSFAKTAESVQKLKEALGPDSGVLGDLPPQVITRRENVAKSFDDSDYARLRERHQINPNDVSPEELRAVDAALDKAQGDNSVVRRWRSRPENLAERAADSQTPSGEKPEN